MANSKIVIVTGANRGIGNAICKLILEDKSITPLTLFATSRAGEDLNLPTRDDQQIFYPSLDISSASSRQAFWEKVQSGTSVLDVLINNAGVNLDNEFGVENASKTLETNYRGTLEMTRAALPMMREKTGEGPGSGGRIVSLSSVGSSLKTWKPELAEKVRAIDSMEELEKMMQEYLKLVEQGRDADTGFPSERSYGVSKTAINVLTKLLARENPEVTINCCCPGWIDTGMGDLVSSRKMKPPKTPEQGAIIPFRLAFGDIGSVSGKYWANESVRSKEDGQVQEW